ncbi:MAG: cyclophilin-like fold protein [Pelobium sp.]
MKSLVAIIAVLFTFLCCSACSTKDKEPAPAQNNGLGNTKPSSTKMKITIGTSVFTATLYDNPSANAFKEMLPLSIDMTELNNNEKYHDLPSILPTNVAVDGDMKMGDLTLYGSKTLVLFYKNFNTSYSYTKLGSFDNPTGLVTALGAGNVVVKFEKN